MSSPSQKVRHLFEAMLTGLLFGMQIICDAGVWMGIMSIPLLPYVFAVLTNEAYAEAFWINMECLFLRENSLIGNVITFAGVFVLLVALAQFLWSRHKGNKLVQSGLYSKMRHPQFTGIITINFGLTLLVGEVPALMYNLLLEKTTFWLIQVLG